MKFGRECEGRFKGIESLFIQATEAIELFTDGYPVTRLKQADMERLSKVKHVYISDHKGLIKHNDACLDVWFDDNMPVTIEVCTIPPLRQLYPENVSFMVRIDVKRDFWKLEPTDQVKFTREKVVMCTTIEALVKTEPDDFRNDVTIHVLGKPKAKFIKNSKATIGKAIAPKKKASKDEWD